MSAPIPARRTPAAVIWLTATTAPRMAGTLRLRAEVTKLVVCDEAALARAEFLHFREQLRALLLGHVEAEFLRLDANGVEAALLAEDDAALGADELGGVR